jgi:cytochrome P450
MSAHTFGVEYDRMPDRRRQPAFVRGHWLLGMGPDILRRPLAMLTELGRLGDVVRFRLPAMRAVLVNHPDLIKRVFHDYKTYDKRMRSYQRLSPLLGDGLATSEGDHWLRQRRIAQPAFHRQRIAGLGETMVRLTEQARDGYLPLARRGEPIDIAAEMTRLTLAIMCESLLGGDVPGDADTLARAFSEVVEYLVERLNLLYYLPLWVPTGANRRCRAALASLDDVVYRMIARRRAQAAESPDLLSMLLAARDEDTGEGMSDRELRDELMTMLLGGHETTAMTLTWAICLLAQHPDAQDRLRAELSTVLGGRSPTSADLARLPYTRMVVDEALRLYPPVWLVARNAAKDDDLGGYAISKGDAVFVSSWVVHRAPWLWDAPDEFRPERFSPEREVELRNAFFPFVGGPRQCIGNAFALMEARLALAVLAQRFRFSLAPGSVVEPEPILTLRPKGVVKVLLEGS